METLTWHQAGGLMTSPEGETIAQGWAGHGEGKNNPEKQQIRETGPLPQGLYKVGKWQDHPRLGRMVARLEQIEGETYGRDGFFIHGPSKDPAKYGQESKGCIVIPYQARLKVKELSPSFIQVVA
mgnify:FL=1